MTDLLNIPRHIFDSFLLSRQQSHYLQQHMFQESPAAKWSLFHTVKGVPEEEYFISHNKLTMISPSNMANNDEVAPRIGSWFNKTRTFFAVIVS